MKTLELRSDTGDVIGFRVSNLFLSRRGVSKIVRSIPSAHLIRQQSRFRLSGPDDFCEFVVDGMTFLTIEPFGDNSEFWVVTEPPEGCTQIAKVREAFTMHRVLLGLYAG